MTMDTVVATGQPEAVCKRQVSRDTSKDTDTTDTMDTVDTGTDMQDTETEDNGSQTSAEEDMATRLNQLQEMVRDMKVGFSTALETLVQIQKGDQVLEQRVNNNKLEHDTQLADVLNMVLSLKSEFNDVLNKLHTATDTQNKLQRQVEILQYERDILLEELERQGVITEQLRSKYHSGRSRPNGLNRSGDQTSLSVMLERAHNVFNSPHAHNVSDHDSGVNTYRDHPDLSSLTDVTPPGVNPFVQSYIAGLQESVHQTPAGSLHQNSHHEDLVTPANDGYESDSSLTAAVNKSLDMSRSLGDRCAEVANLESSEDEDEDSGDKNVMETSNVKSKQPHQSGMQSDEVSCSPEKLRQAGDQMIFAQPLTPKRMAPHERNTKEVQRMQVAHEIMDTERKYCSNLWTIIDLYLGPLQSTGILQPKEASVIFPPSLAAIYDYHCGFLQKLEERMANWKWHSVLGDILCRFIDSAECDLLQQYQAFVSDFPASLNQIRKSCKSSTRFRKFLRMMRRHPSCEGLDIGSFMVTPIQRIPRYVLLLKQLLKYTDRDHPDYYYVETALEHLGDFLNKLNDSIEYSMQMVGSGNSDETPKQRRKIRIGSFRSGSVSSYDINNSKLNDSSMQGGTEDHSILSNSTSASHGRFFNFFLRDSFRRKNANNGSMNQSTSQIQPPSKVNANSRAALNQTVSNSGLPPLDLSGFQRETSFNSSVCREQSLSASTRESGVSGQARAGKKRRPRPRSEVKPFIKGGCDESQEEMSWRQKRARRQRPRSVMDSMSEVSALSSNMTSQIVWTNTTSQESLNTITADDQTLSSATSTRHHARPGSSEYLQIMPNVPKLVTSCPPAPKTKSLPDVSRKSQAGIPKSRHRKLPVPPVATTAQNDFGIYGKNTSLLEDSFYGVSCPSGNSLNVPRSASQGDMMDGSHSPLQHYINMSLARSLTDSHLDDSDPTLPCASESMLDMAPKKSHATVLQSTSKEDKPRPKSAKTRHVTLPREGTRPKVIDLSSQEDLNSDQSIQTPAGRQFFDEAIIEEPSPIKKEMPFRRKKDRSAKKNLQLEPPDKDRDKDKKKGSLKQSIKSLFFRKRKHDSPIILPLTSIHKTKSNGNLNDGQLTEGSVGSRIGDVIPYDELPENGHQVYTPAGSPAKSSVTSSSRAPITTINLQDSNITKRPREQAPPVENVVVLKPVEPQLETYADENGEPCSAV